MSLVCAARHSIYDPVMKLCFTVCLAVTWLPEVGTVPFTWPVLINTLMGRDMRTRRNDE